MAAPKGPTGGDNRLREEINLRDWTRGIHDAILVNRGITRTELAQEMGVSKERVRQILVDGATEATSMRVEDAIDAISARNGLVPRQAMSWPEGAPAPEWVSEEALGELQYRQELTTRDLMRPAGVEPVRGMRARRAGTRGFARRVG